MAVPPLSTFDPRSRICGLARSTRSRCLLDESGTKQIYWQESGANDIKVLGLDFIQINNFVKLPWHRRHPASDQSFKRVPLEVDTSIR